MHATSNGLAPSHYMLRSKFAPASMVISLLRNHYNFSKENVFRGLYFSLFMLTFDDVDILFGFIQMIFHVLSHAV
jgi:hypothetical protein